MNTENENGTGTDPNATPAIPAAPTIEDLRAELDQLKAERVKLKSAFDKSSSEAANYKRQLHERMTAEEQAEAARRETEAKQKEMYDNISHELAVIKAKNRYLKQGMDETTANECAEYEASGDMESLMNRVFAHRDASVASAVKNAQDAWLSNRPTVNAGHGEDNGSEEDDMFLKGFKSK